MSLNLNQYRESLLEARKDVLDDKNDTNWALFGYEGQTNTLKVVGKGSGGIEELIEELNSGKIMYAFLRVTDPKTCLPKYAIINWQGEGANTVRKGICANHLRDVEKFFSGAHLTFNARNEDDLDPQLVAEKLSKTTSAYNLVNCRSEIPDIKTPVGTNYKKVNPIAEINSNERDQFWQKEEQEEKQRKEDERKLKELQRKKFEEEFKVRSVKEPLVDTKTTINNVEDKARETEKFKNVGAGEYIGQLNSRNLIDTFEKNASVSLKKTPEKPVRNSLLKAQMQMFNQTSDETKTLEYQNITVQKQDLLSQNRSMDEPQSDEDSDQFSTIKRSPKDLQKANATNKEAEQKVDSKSNVYSDKEYMQQITEQQFVDEVIYQDLVEGPGLQARALYDYQAADDTEITFDPGDIITNIDQVDEGWWQGLGPDGTYGLFPANYVELIN